MNEINITKLTNGIYAKHKITGKTLKVNLLHIGQRNFNSSDELWGIWHDYSKRGNWELFLKEYKP